MGNTLFGQTDSSAPTPSTGGSELKTPQTMDERLVIGAKVRKKFYGCGDFDGTVVSIDAASSKFQVRWSDGAEHAYGFKAAEKMLDRANGPRQKTPARPRGAKRGRAEPPATLRVSDGADINFPRRASRPELPHR